MPSLSDGAVAFHQRLAGDQLQCDERGQRSAAPAKIAAQRIVFRVFVVVLSSYIVLKSSSTDVPADGCLVKHDFSL